MLTKEQIEFLLYRLQRPAKILESFNHYTERLRITWSLLEDMSSYGNKEELSPTVKKFFEREQRSDLKSLYYNLHELTDIASLAESSLDKEGNFILEQGDNYEEDEGWIGTSNIRTRLVAMMHKLGHTPEQACDALVEVCREDSWQAPSTIKHFSPYKDDFDKEELNKRLRLHIYGQEHEDAIASGDIRKAMALKRKKDDAAP